MYALPHQLWDEEEETELGKAETWLARLCEVWGATVINAESEAKPDATIEREWSEAERAFEVVTAHTVAQVAQAIPSGKVALVTEIADYFTALAAKLTPRPAGNGEAPAAGSNYSIPADLSFPPCLRRSPAPGEPTS